MTFEALLKPQQILSYATRSKSIGLDVERRKVQDIINFLWLPASMTIEERDACIVRAINLYQRISPTDGIEAMLALQMVAAHHAAMESSRRAALENQTSDGRNRALSQAQKLMGLYVNQTAALDKHRGKGQQQVTVKHVYVEAGGQAIVGNVNSADGKEVTPTIAAAGRAALAAPAQPILPPVSSAMKRARVPRP